LAIEYAYVSTQASTHGGTQVGGSVIHREYRCAAARDAELVTIPVKEVDGETTVSYRGSTRQVRWCRRCGLKPTLAWAWQDKAECMSAWPAVDMIEMPRGNHQMADQLIAQFCKRCPVVRECAQFALDSIEDAQGIWGGVFIHANVGGKNQKRRTKGIQVLRDVCGIVSEDAA
jgi:hypothetical protein